MRWTRAMFLELGMATFASVGCQNSPPRFTPPALREDYILPPQDVVRALTGMERVGREKYLVVESFRDAEELFNLQCWALTCESFFSPDEWIWLFKEFGYTGDYEFIYFE